MADIAKSGTPSLASIGPDPGACKLPTFTCGENIAAGDACYIKNDGQIWRSTGAAVAAAAQVHGFAPMAANAGETLTLMYNVTFRYGASLTPGTRIYLSGATVGAIADAASTGGTAPVGFVVDGSRIYLKQSAY